MSPCYPTQAYDKNQDSPPQAHDALVRTSAALTLVRIGPEAKEAAPALIAALKDQDAGVRSSAASALETIKPETEHL